MGRFRNSQTGVVVSVADSKDDRFAAPLWRIHDGSDARDGAEGYEAMKVAELKAEIERRNEDRDEVDLIPVDGKKADLVAALQLDDDAHTEQ
jgi:hypothetical protein